MKRILITGENSYIGTSFANKLSIFPDNYSVSTINLKNPDWVEHDFSEYDVMFHVAGIAHVSSNPRLKDKYNAVNRDLAYEVAIRAKHDGVKQFIFLSSMNVYGSKTEYITSETLPDPSSIYGKSKYEAEKLINRLHDDTFKIVILRSPMVYGKGCKGNYSKLANLALKTPIFPSYNNQRSMLHIDNLCEFVKLLVDFEDDGLFFPQNKEYVNTSELVKKIAEHNNHKILFINWFNPLIKLFSKVNPVKKVFGNLVYDLSISEYSRANYRLKSFDESIEKTEI